MVGIQEPTQLIVPECPFLTSWLRSLCLAGAIFILWCHHHMCKCNHQKEDHDNDVFASGKGSSRGSNRGLLWSRIFFNHVGGINKVLELEFIWKISSKVVMQMPAGIVVLSKHSVLCWLMMGLTKKGVVFICISGLFLQDALP
ncbi:hypothetical protein VNO80_08093 [Phaseolus coccineus]|uniref:Uncharacterized protein n=1 Tax=Phaseolus coccineus TaxID=3886 RepID=A0AAN9NKF9_PHACN